MKNNPIGVFDSGLGGLTVVREVRRLLPHEDIHYFGDSARLPYGTKSKKQIIQFSLDNAEYLLSKNIKALVIACNSSSANAYATLKRKLKIPVIDVIRPVSKAACRRTQSGRIGVLGTTATIKSEAYHHALRRISETVKIFSQDCPLFVPLVEEGWLKGPITRSVVEKYLSPCLRKKIDTLILGCTHYPLLKSVVQSVAGKSVRVVDSGPSAAEALLDVLTTHGLLSNRRRRGSLHISVSDLSPHFIAIGERFLQHAIPKVSVVRW